MSLQVIFDKMVPLIVAAAGVDGGPPPFVALGEEHLPNPRVLPAIVWVPRGGPVVPPRQSGAYVQNPRQLWTRHETVHVYVYAGTGFQETEDLVGQLVAAMTAQMSLWSFRVTQMSWSHGWPVVTTDEPRADLTSGTLCIVTIELHIPLVAALQKEAFPTTKTITGTIVPAGA